jgi:hypothetical protein
MKIDAPLTAGMPRMLCGLGRPVEARGAPANADETGAGLSPTATEQD